MIEFYNHRNFIKHSHGVYNKSLKVTVLIVLQMFLSKRALTGHQVMRKYHEQTLLVCIHNLLLNLALLYTPPSEIILIFHDKTLTGVSFAQVHLLS